MKNAYANFQSLHNAWVALRKARPSEDNFEAFGFKESKAEDFDALFDEWELALSEAASKTKHVGGDDRALEILIVRNIVELSNQVNPAVSNGFQWLLQSSTFLQKMSELHTALIPILDRRFRVRKAVVDSAKADLIGDISRVEAAAPLADKLATLQTKIIEQTVEVAEALTVSQAAKDQATTDAAEISEHLRSIQHQASDATEAKAGFDQTVTEAKTLLGDAGKALTAVEAARKKSDAAIVEGERLVGLAAVKLDKAIADINRQGLAGSFHTTARNLGRERLYWLGGFMASIIYLVLVACGYFGNGLNIQSSLPLWEQLLHVLPLAAPGIWVGWFTARNASMTARIQQDYAYKVATAQSFEAHKREVMLPGNEALTQKLLEITISNFGDNPIRLYDGKGLEGHPLESLKTLMADKDFDKIIRFLTAMRPGG